jgi:hypothetical protein
MVLWEEYRAVQPAIATVASVICSGNSSGACRLPCGRTIRPATRYLSITPARKS